MVSPLVDDWLAMDGAWKLICNSNLSIPGVFSAVYFLSPDTSLRWTSPIPLKQTTSRTVGLCYPFCHFPWFSVNLSLPYGEKRLVFLVLVHMVTVTCFPLIYLNSIVWITESFTGWSRWSLSQFMTNDFTSEEVGNFFTKVSKRRQLAPVKIKVSVQASCLAVYGLISLLL